MKWRAGTPAGRIAAVLILLAVSAGVVGLALVPMWNLNQRLDVRLAELHRELAAQRRIADASAGLEPILEQLRQALADDARYLKSSTDALAGAELQGMVKKAILSKGGNILSTQIVSAAPEGRFITVVLRVKMRATLEETVEIFYTLETGEPHLFLNNVGLSARAPRGRSRVPLTEPASLEVQFDLAGYLRADIPG